MKQYLIIVLSFFPLPIIPWRIPPCSQGLLPCRDISEGSVVARVVQGPNSTFSFEGIRLKMERRSRIELPYGANLSAIGDQNNTIEMAKRSSITCSYGNIAPSGPDCRIAIEDRSLKLLFGAWIFLGRASLSITKDVRFETETVLFGIRASLVMMDKSSVEIRGSFRMINFGVPPRIIVGYGARLEITGKIGEGLYVGGFVNLARRSLFSLRTGCIAILSLSKLRLEAGAELILDRVRITDDFLNVNNKYVKFGIIPSTNGSSIFSYYAIPNYELILEGRQNSMYEYLGMTFHQCVQLFKSFRMKATGFTYIYDEFTRMGTCRLGSNGFTDGRSTTDVLRTYISGITEEEYALNNASCIAIHDKSSYKMVQGEWKMPGKFEFKYSKGRFLIATANGTVLTLEANGSISLEAMNISDVRQVFKFSGTPESCQIMAFDGQCINMREGKFAVGSCGKEWQFERLDSNSEYQATYLELERATFESRGTTQITGCVILLFDNSRFVVDGYNTFIGLKMGFWKKISSPMIKPQLLLVGHECHLLLTNGDYRGYINVGEQSEVEIVARTAEVKQSEIYVWDDSKLALSGDSIEIIDSLINIKGHSKIICRAYSIAILHATISLLKDGAIFCGEMNKHDITLMGWLKIPYNTEMKFESGAEVIQGDFDGEEEQSEIIDFEDDDKRTDFDPDRGFGVHEEGNTTCPYSFKQLEHGDYCVLIYTREELLHLPLWKQENICYERNGLWWKVPGDTSKATKEYREQIDLMKGKTSAVEENDTAPVFACRRKQFHPQHQDLHYISSSRIAFNMSGSHERDVFTRLVLVFKGKFYMHGELSVVNQHWSRSNVRITFHKEVKTGPFASYIIDLAELQTQDIHVRKAQIAKSFDPIYLHKFLYP